MKEYITELYRKYKQETRSIEKQLSPYSKHQINNRQNTFGELQYDREKGDRGSVKCR